ncbi:5016_t:CDS:2 [Funneliformis mosseae]|uniref:5016_t:CDS:1 n=1 Tax=Funneliformis mosseae TaxID=27381 RepID=A0A9N9DU79_FUNMO|nr:5016_t:CDS:2 [Funneliformis mosseae]
MGELDLTVQSGENIFGLLIASDEFLLEELFEHVQDFLLEKHTSWIQQNLVLVVHTTPGLGSKNCDRSKWSKENFKTLKETLSPFIPLIRFVNISRVDFFDRVRPYKSIISKYIYDEVEEFYYKDTLPRTTALTPRVGKLASNIIKPILATIISNWIDRNDSIFPLFNNRYKFNLIYLKSRDGLDRTNYTSWNFFNFGNQLYNVGPDLFLYDFDTYENYYDIDTKVDVGLPIEDIEVFSFEGLFPGLTLTTSFILYTLTDVSINNKETSSSRSPTTKTLKRTTSQSSLDGTSSSSAVAHTVSPTPSVLSNISQIQLPTSVLNFVKKKPTGLLLLVPVLNVSACISHDAKDC